MGPEGEAANMVQEQSSCFHIISLSPV